MDLVNMRLEREYSVVKSNELIRNTRYDLSVIEQKIVLRLIQMIKPGDTELREYEFSINDFCDLCGIERNNGANYLYIKSAMKKLRDKSFWMKINGADVLCSWVSKVKVNYRSGTILIRLDNDLKPFLLQLKKNFTEYALFYILAMKSKYSIRMYELLKSYRYMGGFTITPDELRNKMCVVGYSRFYDLRTKVIENSLNEINLYGDIKVSYDYKKSGNSVESITFSVKQKSGKEDDATLRNIGTYLMAHIEDFKKEGIYNYER
jgi:Protein involved in initiation of plasmid replication